MGKDPATGMPAYVALVDIRDPVEIFFSGAPAEVYEIDLVNGSIIVPDGGRVRLIQAGKFIEYQVDGRYQRLQVAKVSQLRMTQLAVNVPYWFRDESSWPANPDFKMTIEGLADSSNVLILFCRTGGRSSRATSDFDTSLFDAVYEIDDPLGLTGGVGGFSGSTYQNGYNGHIGFAGRQTDMQEHPSVSWMDSGLPIATMTLPNVP
jgi:rhodanese-related sulfurtransferase